MSIPSQALDAMKPIMDFAHARPLAFAAGTHVAFCLSRFLFSLRGKSLSQIKKDILELVMGALAVVPGAQGAIDEEERKIVAQMKEKVIKDVGGPVHASMPKKGLSRDEVLGALKQWADAETTWKDGKVSGTVYHGGTDLTKIIVGAFEQFALSNPLHVDVFPAIRKMEAEVISMTADLFKGSKADVCGSLTSGGTESIVLSVRTHKVMAQQQRGVKKPNIVVPITAHAAFDKACDLMEIELRHFSVDNEFRANVAEASKLVDRNTILVVGSAPSFPQGVIDPIRDLAKLAQSVGAGMHVDCCLGSFLLPFSRKIGRTGPDYNFDVDGVTAISVDTHKFGFAPKGSSVVLYANPEIRKFQFFVMPEWTGGIYATPTIAGSRPGALIAGAWAVMSNLGQAGYEKCAKEIMEATDKILQGISAIPDLKILSKPDLSVICFESNLPSMNILHIGDEMSARGWSLNTLQNPTSIHICVTLVHAAPGVADQFVKDLEESVAACKKAGSGQYKDGMSAIYGMAGSVPAGMVSSLAKSFLDVLYSA